MGQRDAERMRATEQYDPGLYVGSWGHALFAGRAKEAAALGRVDQGTVPYSVPGSTEIGGQPARYAV